MQKFILVVKFGPNAAQACRYVGPFLTPEAAWKQAVYWHLDPHYYSRDPVVGTKYPCRSNADGMMYLSIELLEGAAA
ncbi:hypothetical protein [Rhizobium phage RHEph12]|nr:hypothetical protein [Rhizobium phage RHEph12]